MYVQVDSGMQNRIVTLHILYMVVVQHPVKMYASQNGKAYLQLSLNQHSFVP